MPPTTTPPTTTPTTTMSPTTRRLLDERGRPVEPGGTGIEVPHAAALPDSLNGPVFPKVPPAAFSPAFSRLFQRERSLCWRGGGSLQIQVALQARFGLGECASEHVVRHEA